MIKLRSFLFNVFFFGFLSICLVFMLLGLPFRRGVLQWMVRMWSSSVAPQLRWIVGIEQNIKGLENLPDGPALIVSKHQSAWDTIVFYTLLGDPQYVLKKELLRIPLWGWFAIKCQAHRR